MCSTSCLMVDLPFISYLSFLTCPLVYKDFKKWKDDLINVFTLLPQVCSNVGSSTRDVYGRALLPPPYLLQQ